MIYLNNTYFLKWIKIVIHVYVYVYVKDLFANKNYDLHKLIAV